MKYHAPTKCPVCSNTMEITKVQCAKCNTELTGKFSPCRFCVLEDKHLDFVENFLRCRGSIKEMEKVMGVSYPTVRNMMDAALQALGLGDKPDATEEQREAILSKLSCNEIGVDEAVKALNKLKGVSNE